MIPELGQDEREQTVDDLIDEALQLSFDLGFNAPVFAENPHRAGTEGYDQWEKGRKARGKLPILNEYDPLDYYIEITSPWPEDRNG